jgi:hypothetical protein
MMSSPAHADIAGVSATLKKATQHTAGVSKVRLGTVGTHASRTVRHARTVTRARPVIHKINRPVVVHRVVARKAVWTHRVVRPAVHRAALPTRAAAHRIAALKAHSRSTTHRASKITSTHKITATAHKSRHGTTKITATAGKAQQGTTKITAAVGKSTARTADSAGAIAARGLLKPVADTGAILSGAIQPVVQPVQTPVSQLRDRVLAVLTDKIAQGIPPVIDLGGQPGNLLPPLGNQPGFRPGQQAAIAADSAQAPPSIVAARSAHPLSDQRDDITATPSTGSGLMATLGDLAAGVREVLLGITASHSGATAAIALLTVVAGVAAAGSATSGGPASISLAFVEGGLLTSAAGRSRRLGNLLRQTGWRTPHRPSFSPD